MNENKKCITTKNNNKTHGQNINQLNVICHRIAENFTVYRLIYTDKFMHMLALVSPQKKWRYE